MKNIHVLSTDKPSNLFEIDGHLIINRKQLIQPKYYRNIYITSDEEIGTDEYYFHLKNNEYYNSGRIDEIDKDMKFWRKIILTTDQDLIKDGVQAIDDEFLEWFVKNPNCEFVETLFHYPTICDEEDYSLNLGYWTIIIPKEEPKQETTSNYIDRHVVEAMVEIAKQKIYSEEDLKFAYTEGCFAQLRYIDGKKFVNADEWFEKFKKK